MMVIFYSSLIPEGGVGEIAIAADLSGLILNIDADNDGIFESQAEPSIILSEEASNDFLPPISTASATGTLGADGW